MGVRIRAPVMILIFLAATVIWQPPAIAHSWYPKECCDDRDCTPVAKVAPLMSKDGNHSFLIISSLLGKAVVPADFPVRVSKDGRIHICMSYDPFGDRSVVCLFMPPYV